jgi:hypothetical protein
MEGVARPRLSVARRWLAPPFTALVFLVPCIVAVCRPEVPLQDPGTGWHLASGRYILETGTIPDRDLFSFTAVGHEWISYCWLFEVVGAFLVKVGGLPLYTTACMLAYGLVPVLLFRRMLRIGAGMVPALLFMLFALLVLASHALARPHVLTYVFFALLLERLDDFRTGRVPASGLWWLPLLAAVWANVHGGFVAGLVTTAIFVAVAGLRWWRRGDRVAGRQTVVLAGVLVAMAAATLLNPSGLRLHTSILDYLSQDSARYFNEFASPDFHLQSAPIFFFELLVLLTIGIRSLVPGRIALVETILLVFFLHEALHSVRHMNLFAIVAAPILAREVTPAFARRWPRLHRRTAEIAREQAALRSPLLYFPAIAAIGVLLATTGVIPFPRTLDDLQLSRGAAEFIDQHRERFSRPFNTDNLGGSLVYRFWPDLHIFVDDRIFVYGEDFISKRYFEVLYARKGWKDVLGDYGVTSALMGVGSPCTTLFRSSPEWELAFEDDKNAIFFRRSGADGPTTPIPPVRRQTAPTG